MGFVESDDGNISIYYIPSTLQLDIEKNPFLRTNESFALISSGAYLASSIYDINPIGYITPPALMTFKYDPPLYGSKLGLFRFNSSTSLWEEITSAVVDESNNQIIANITNLSLYAVMLKGDESDVVEANVSIKPETLKVNPGVLTAFVSLPEPYSVSDIVYATCDGAQYKSMELSTDESYMIIKFQRTEIEDALSMIGEELDTEFLVRGYLSDGTLFIGTDTIKKINN